MQKIFELVESKFGFRPISLIDVGARFGKQRPWNQIPAKYLTYYGFEADNEECERLNNNRINNSVVYFPFALSDNESTETLFVTQEKGSSSFYKPNYTFSKNFFYGNNWKIDKEIKLQTTTLKKVFTENNIRPDFLKIDTQGSELKILKGTGDYLESVL